jgi:hypothetical protein
MFAPGRRTTDDGTTDDGTTDDDRPRAGRTDFHDREDEGGVVGRRRRSRSYRYPATTE